MNVHIMINLTINIITINVVEYNLSTSNEKLIHRLG